MTPTTPSGSLRTRAALESDQARRPQALGAEHAVGVAADPASAFGRHEQLARYDSTSGFPVSAVIVRAISSSRSSSASPSASNRRRRSDAGTRRHAFCAAPAAATASAISSSPQRGPPTRRRASRGSPTAQWAALAAATAVTGELAVSRRSSPARQRAPRPTRRCRARERARAAPRAAPPAPPPAARAPDEARQPARSTSNGLTTSAHGASSSAAPAFSESTSTPSRVVQQRALLGDEVEPVEDRVHEQHVVLRVRGDRERKVVPEPQVDHRPRRRAR